MVGGLNYRFQSKELNFNMVIILRVLDGNE